MTRHRCMRCEMLKIIEAAILNNLKQKRPDLSSIAAGIEILQDQERLGCKCKQPRIAGERVGALLDRRK